LALPELEFVLAQEPEHFAARLLQSLCFLRLDRPAEAKVALTACMAQRPRFGWNYLLRWQAHTALGKVELAGIDFDSILAGRPSDALSQVVQLEHREVHILHQDIGPDKSISEATLRPLTIVPQSPK